MSAQTARKLHNSGFQTMHLHHVQNAPGWVHRLKSTDLNRLHCINFGRATDPACGAGATLIAAANAMKRGGVNYQQGALFIGQDVDSVVAKMCFIQLSLLGCAGYICVGDSLINPVNGPDVLFPEEREGQEIWYMPMFATPVWRGRRLVRQMDALLRSAPETQEPEYTFFFDFKEDGYERNSGQGESQAG